MGSYWDDDYKVLEAQNIVVAGAAVGTVSVLGFLLGGPMTLRNGEYSLGSDGIWGLKLSIGWERFYTSLGAIRDLRNYPERSKTVGVVLVP